MDFFAGSGTLGAAVQKINSEDAGKRKYILAQLPEPIDVKNKENHIENQKYAVHDQSRNHRVEQLDNREEFVAEAAARFLVL